VRSRRVKNEDIAAIHLDARAPHEALPRTKFLPYDCGGYLDIDRPSAGLNAPYSGTRFEPPEDGGGYVDEAGGGNASGSGSRSYHAGGGPK